MSALPDCASSLQMDFRYATVKNKQKEGLKGISQLNEKLLQNPKCDLESGLLPFLKGFCCREMGYLRHCPKVRLPDLGVGLQIGENVTLCMKNMKPAEKKHV